MRAGNFLRILVGLATASCFAAGLLHAQSCPTASAQPQSLIYGYEISDPIHVGSSPTNYVTCTGPNFFQTLEQAENALRNDPTVPGYGAAQLAFPLRLGDMSGSLVSEGRFYLDYRPSGTIGNSTMYLPPAITGPVAYAIYSPDWPPSGSHVSDNCLAQENACNLGNFCPTLKAEQDRLICQINNTYPGAYGAGTYVTGSRFVGTLNPGATSIEAFGTRDAAGGALGIYHTQPTSYAAYSSSGQWLSVDIYYPSGVVSAASTTPNIPSPAPASASSVQQTAAITTGSTQTSNFGIQSQQSFDCPPWYDVNLLAASQGVPGFVCQNTFYKRLIQPPTMQQTDQPCVGDPCYPGNGNATVDEEGIRYGNIRYSLHYNSLRQLRAYAFIDTNWSATFSQRILTSDLTNDHDKAISPIFVQNDRGHLEQFNAINGAANTFRSTNHTGDVLQLTYDASNKPSGFRLRYASGEIHVFDLSGRITQIIAPDDPRKTVSMTYQPIPTITDQRFWQIDTVTDGTGRFIKFQYDTTAPFYVLLNVIGDNKAVLMSLSYDAKRRLASTTQPDANGKLTQTRTYHYDEPANILKTTSNPNNDLPYHLTSVSDENHPSDATRYVNLTYDDWGRATANWLGSAGAGKVTLRYTENFTPTNVDATTSYVYVTTPLGDVVTYDYVSNQPYRKPDTIASQNQGQEQLNYDPITHVLISKFDRRRTETDYEYTDQIHQTAVVEAKGTTSQRRTETDWDAQLNRRTEVRVKDASGVLQARRAWKYNARGQVQAYCEFDVGNSSAMSYSCGANTAAPTGVRQTAYTYCETADVVPGSTCPIIGLLKSLDGPRTDVSDITSYAYWPSTDVSGCGTAGGACHHVGDAMTVTDAAGNQTSTVTLDRAGRVTRMRDANNVYIDMTYHPRGWLSQSIRRANADGSANAAADQVTQFAYDNVGNVTRITQPDGTYLAYGYDDAHRLTDTYDSAGNHIHYGLDAAGNRTQETIQDASGTTRRTLSRQYDQLSQLTAILNAASIVVQQYRNPSDPVRLGGTPPWVDGYDFNGNPVYWLDANNVGTEQQYDPLNRLVSTVQDHNLLKAPSTNATTQYTYDTQDNLTGVLDPDNLTTSYTYDALNNLSQLTSPDTGTTRYTSYDAAGNRLTQIDARGVQTNYVYDALNRLIAIQYPASPGLNVAYTYDTVNPECASAGVTAAKRHLTKIVDSSGQTTYCWGGNGNLRIKTQVTNGQTLVTSWTYTIANRPYSQTYPSGKVLYYSYDTAGRISGVTYNGGTLVSSVDYYPFGPVKKVTFGNGRTLTKTYDQNYAISSVVSSDVNGLAIYASVDALGNLTSASTTAGANPPTQQYQYDQLYRLSTVQSGVSVLQSFTYSLGGDRTSATPQGQPTRVYSYYTGTHRLASIDGVQRNYDENGNMTYSPALDTATYDARNRMTAAADIAFDYNGRGERVLKTGSLFTYDESGHLLGEYTPAAAVRAEYVYLDETPIAYIAGGILYYIETDQLGTPRAVVKPGATSAADTTVWKWDYFAGNSAFGENTPSVQTIVFNLRFPGQYYDSETGLNYNYFRDYEPGTGRYVEADPIGLKGGGPQLYAYVYSSPIVWPDPTGLSAGESQCCVRLKRLIQFDAKQQGPSGVLLDSDYAPLSFDDNLLGLDCCYQTKGGPVSGDWMLRTAYLGLGRSPVISCGIYAVAKPTWNLMNLTNPLANFLDECKRNSCLAASYWLNSKQPLADMFQPALKKCDGRACK